MLAPSGDAALWVVYPKGVPEIREMEVLERTLAGTIESSLFESIVAAGGSPQLVNKFADIYAWRLNLSRLQPGDHFKLIYDERQVNGNVIGFGKIKSAYFEHEGKELYAIGFQQGKSTGYYDQMHFIRDFRQFTGVTPTGLEVEMKSNPFPMQKGMVI
mgnify:CR=1 FL=1